MKKNYSPFAALLLILILPACDGDSSGSAPSLAANGTRIIPLPGDFSLVSATGNTPPPVDSDRSNLAESQIEQQIFDAINQARQQRGLSSLTQDTRLTALGDEHNRTMALAGQNQQPNFGLSHVDFQSRSQVVFSLGYRTVGENVAVLGNLPNSALASNFSNNWLNSPKHLNNITSAVTATGVSVYIDPVTRLVYATQIFAG